MPRNYSHPSPPYNVPRWKRNVAYLAAAGSIATGLGGCESGSVPDMPAVTLQTTPHGTAADPTIASFVDCKKNPYGTSSVVAQPGKIRFQGFGYAEQQPDGSLHWISRLVLQEYSGLFNILADGQVGPSYPYETYPGSHKSDFVQGQYRHLLTQLPNASTGAPGGYIDALPTHFDSADPTSWDNRVTITWHCGDSPTGPVPPESL